MNRRWIILAVLALDWAWIGPSTFHRLRESDPRPVELAASYEAWRTYSQLTEFHDPWAYLRSQGFTTLMTSDVSPSHLSAIRALGFRVGIYLSPRAPLADLKTLNQVLVLLDESEVQGSSAFIQYLCGLPNLKFGSVEFSKSPSLKWLPPSFQRSLLTVHDIAPLQFQELSPESAQSRYVRAVFERQVDMLVVNPHPALATFPQQEAWIAQLLTKLGRVGRVTGESAPTTPSSMTAEKAQFIKWTVWILTVLSPFFLGWWLSFHMRDPSPRFGSAVWAYLLTCLVTLSAGLTIAHLLHDPMFSEKIVQFPAVKLALFLPLGSLMILGLRSQWKSFERFWRQQTLNYHAGLIAVGALLIFSSLAVMLLRSGHSGLPPFPMETVFREWLEHWLTARPRFKEFLIGYPALLIYLAYRRPAAQSQAVQWTLLFIGLVGPISTLNTFCHAHAPLSTSLLRTLHGFWLGGLLGALLLIGSRIVHRPVRPS